MCSRLSNQFWPRITQRIGGLRTVRNRLVRVIIIIISIISIMLLFFSMFFVLDQRGGFEGASCRKRRTRKRRPSCLGKLESHAEAVAMGPVDRILGTT